MKDRYWPCRLVNLGIGALMDVSSGMAMEFGETQCARYSLA
jgi:hypothetical protein